MGKIFNFFVLPDHSYVTIKISAFCVKYHFYQFASYLFKMSFTGKEKAFCVLEFDKNNSWTCVQRKFRREFLKQPPDRRIIQKWHAKFKEEGCLCSRKKIAPSSSTETIEKVQNIFQRSPRKSIRRASRELQMSSTSVWRVVRKHLHLIPYKLHSLQHLKDTDKPACEDFCTQMQAMLKEDGFVKSLIKRLFL